MAQKKDQTVNLMPTGVMLERSALIAVTKKDQTFNFLPSKIEPKSNFSFRPSLEVAGDNYYAGAFGEIDFAIALALRYGNRIATEGIALINDNPEYLTELATWAVYHQPKDSLLERVTCRGWFSFTAETLGAGFVKIYNQLATLNSSNLCLASSSFSSKSSSSQDSPHFFQIDESEGMKIAMVREWLVKNPGWVIVLDGINQYHPDDPIFNYLPTTGGVVIALLKPNSKVPTWLLRASLPKQSPIDYQQAKALEQVSFYQYQARMERQKSGSVLEEKRLTEVEKFLKKKENGPLANWQNHQGSSTTHWAVRMGSLRLLRLLNKYDVRFDLNDSHGVSPICLAAMSDDATDRDQVAQESNEMPEMIAYLNSTIQDRGENLGLFDNHYNSIVVLAADNKRNRNLKKIVELYKGNLLRSFFNQNFFSQNPFHLVAKKGFFATLKILLEAISKLTQFKDLPKLLNEQDLAGNTPLHLVALSASDDARELALILKLHGAKEGVLNNQMKTPYDLAQGNGQLENSSKKKLLTVLGAQNESDLNVISEMRSIEERDFFYLRTYDFLSVRISPELKKWFGKIVRFYVQIYYFGFNDALNALRLEKVSEVYSDYHKRFLSWAIEQEKLSSREITEIQQNKPLATFNDVEKDVVNTKRLFSIYEPAWQGVKDRELKIFFLRRLYSFVQETAVRIADCQHLTFFHKTYQSIYQSEQEMLAEWQERDQKPAKARNTNVVSLLFRY
jgi:ankyrin repeat protein